MPKRVEADGIIHIRRVEIKHIAGAVAWDAVDDLFGQIAMRVDQGDASPRMNVLQNSGFEKSRLPRPSLTNHVNVASSVFLGQ